MSHSQERHNWELVKKSLIKHEVTLGRHISYQFLNSPRRILHMISYYKFSSKVIGSNKRVLDIGCGEGLGTWLLAVECGQAKGIDFDHEAIEVGKKNWNDPRISFEASDLLSLRKDIFDAVVNFDVIEHILPQNIPGFWQKISDSLTHDGIIIVGTPNITSDQYASQVTKAGHVNLYSGERLEAEMKQYFTNVFMFGANDEVIHTGYLPMAHYLIAVGCRRRKKEK